MKILKTNEINNNYFSDLNLVFKNKFNSLQFFVRNNSYFDDIFWELRFLIRI